MAVKDIRSNLKQVVALSETISTAVTEVGGVIDGANYELGIMFGVNVLTYNDPGITIDVQSADDTGFTENLVTYTDASPEIIGTLAGVAVTAATLVVDDDGNYEADTYFMKTFGLFSNGRYIRVRATGDGTGDAVITVIATQMGEQLPITAN